MKGLTKREEDVMNIIKVEKPIGVVVAFGGQTAIKLTKFLDDNGFKIFGTSAEGIDIASVGGYEHCDFRLI